MKKLRIATRKSQLAVWQAEYVANSLKSLEPGLDVELVRMSTRGDRILDAPLAKVGGKGLFVKELEQGMLNGDADIAVHSMKDVPVHFPKGLMLAAVMQRDDPRDALVSIEYSSLDHLPGDVHIGTSSLRRQLQLKSRFPHCRVSSLRGNVNTRLQKLEAGDYDAIILAAAGLKRLDLEGRISECIPVTQSLPAIGQGAIGIECRAGDEELLLLLRQLDHGDTALCVRCERAMNERLNGGCQVPIAGFAEFDGELIHLRGLIGDPDGTHVVRAEELGSAGDPEELGHRLAERLLSQGGDKILKEFLETSRSD